MAEISGPHHIMKKYLIFILLSLAANLFAQTRETVTFRHEATLTLEAVYVLGNLPELGGDDLV